ncbi:HAD-IC family P-type ATPase [Polaromonas sp.]|uniref:cation-translocating P-type ATPase n=1 Tax=Polaromonas sp. TaxID=1869339 RepID=UPI00272F1821|nr:HAD-IC family P-type ATPase [Polaromonas sp.]
MWHTLSTDEALHELSVDVSAGLSAEEVARRMARYGRNSLPASRRRGPWLRLVLQFHNPLIYVLLGAGVVTFGLKDYVDTGVIAGVVLINACIGFIQEGKAEKALDAVRAMLASRATVLRGGARHDIDAALLVPGDIVLLESGVRVPADLRLLRVKNLRINEAALTGESLPADKDTQAVAGDASIGDRNCMAYGGTVVSVGQARGLVVGTGQRTEIGRIGKLVGEVQSLVTPLTRRLDQFARQITLFILAAGLITFGYGYGVREMALLDIFLAVVGLTVAAIPEGLPAIVTIVLALGTRSMARKNAIVRRLPAVETLGSVTVICSDKTGTLTLNQMTARAGWFAGRRFAVSGEGYAPDGRIAFESESDLRPFLLPMTLCIDSRVRDGQLIGDPTEGALWVLAQKGGLNPEAEQEEQPRIAEIPFDSAHKFMATFHHAGETVEMFIKGAPDVLLARSTHSLAEDGEQLLDAAARAAIEAENEHLAAQALRVLAVARKIIPIADFDPAGDLWAWAGGWTFLGLAGLMDPPRPEAKAAIAHCARAGIQVKMITGDHKVTAAAIGRELGLTGEVIEGWELDAMSETELSRRIDGISVFARVAPEHKVKIVRALKDDGHVVAMTGDGVNDAPALKAADIGVAMGITGTAVTKEAAVMVLTDDNFATIVKTVKEGRVIYDNIVKFVRFQLSTNIGAILTVLAATLLGLPAPFTAIQLLWINIIMDGPPAMTLGVEPARAGIMSERPRRQAAQILTGPRLARLALYGAIMMVGTLYLFRQGLEMHGQTYALTLAFTTFVLFQFFNVFNARAETGSAFNTHFFRNGKLWLALVGVLMLQILVVNWPPAQGVFGTTALELGDWFKAVAVASSVLLLDELKKYMVSLARNF